MVYINHQGETKSLTAVKEIEMILVLGKLYVTALSTIHIPGVNY